MLKWFINHARRSRAHLVDDMVEGYAICGVRVRDYEDYTHPDHAAAALDRYCDRCAKMMQTAASEYEANQRYIARFAARAAQPQETPHD